jgi:hypothetical protein
MASFMQCYFHHSEMRDDDWRMSPLLVEDAELSQVCPALVAGYRFSATCSQFRSVCVLGLNLCCASVSVTHTPETCESVPFEKKWEEAGKRGKCPPLHTHTHTHTPQHEVAVSLRGKGFITRGLHYNVGVPRDRRHCGLRWHVKADRRHCGLRWHVKADRRHCGLRWHVQVTADHDPLLDEGKACVAQLAVAFGFAVRLSHPSTLAGRFDCGC